MPLHAEEQNLPPFLKSITARPHRMHIVWDIEILYMIIFFTGMSGSKETSNIIRVKENSLINLTTY